MAEESKSNIEKRELTQELKESYLSYAMSVIVARALPDVRDGLKPVQRRILWAMWDSGLTSGSKFRKSANITGETMGRYHPHGNMPIYEALVRMAQDFSLRYPLIQGQGNFGSLDGDPAAAERYTEARLSKIAEEMLTDIDKETVDWSPNYDATRQEPKVLPAKLPNLLLNGTVGIAVGMATNIPPHNAGEVIDATLHLIDDPEADMPALMKYFQGPDFPTGGIIYDRKAIVDAYTTGRGTITTRGVADIKEGEKARQLQIIITEIPYQVNKAELIIKIANLVQEKKVEGIRDVRDESDRTGLRVVIELKADAAPQKILNQLYEYTDLQKDFHLNMLALADGLQPQVMSLKDVLQAYVAHRQTVVRRRAEFDLRRAEERAHILEGLSIALADIDRVIAVIKKSADKEEAHKELIKIFKLSDRQTTAILEMRLQTLASLERQRIEDELKEKRKLIEDLKLLLKSPKKILQVIKDELADVRKKFGDERRTKVVAGSLKEFNEEDLIPQEETVITFSKSGNIKRMAPSSFKMQKRGGKGLIGSDLAEEDFLTQLLSANTHDYILFFTDRGRVFQTRVYDIPASSRTSKGKSIHNFLEIPQEEKISAIVSYASSSKAKSEEASSHSLIMVTKQGMIKKTNLRDFANVRRTGIIAIGLKKGDLLQEVKLSSGQSDVIIATRFGQAIRFRESQLRAMGRGAGGVRAIKLKEKDEISSLGVIEKDTKKARFLVVTAHGFAKQTSLTEYKVQKRGGSGIKTLKLTNKTGVIISAQIIDEEIELLALSAKGQVIRIEIASIRLAGRATQGVRVMKLNAGDQLIGAVTL